jgi:hypothetical protein
MTDNRDNPYPHARAFGESLGKRLAQCNGPLPVIGTWTVGNAAPVYKYRATYARGAKGITAPIHAEVQAVIYARNDDDAERCAEHIARDRVDYLITCARAE